MNTLTKYILIFACSLIPIVSCTTNTPSPKNSVIISVEDQKMLVIQENKPIKTYPVSTSKFGLGDQHGSNCTPLGTLKVAKKIGTGAPKGAVFKSRKRTGEILKPNAPGRDPIVTRILWLRGLESENRNAFQRYIYIHGTPEERTVGLPRSYGCIRMKSRDIVNLYNTLDVNSKIYITKTPLAKTPMGERYYHPQAPKKQQPNKNLNS